MKKMRFLFAAILLLFIFSLQAADNTFIDYQNYNHGYCATCNYAPCICEPAQAQTQAPSPATCPPSAPVCGTESGVSICAIGAGIAAVTAAAAIIIASGSGSSTTHSAN